MTANELDAKLQHLSRKLGIQRSKIEDLEEDLEHNPIGDSGVGAGYVMANQAEDRADDTSAQIERMNDLANKCQEGLDMCKEKVDEFRSTSKIESIKESGLEPLRWLDQEVWKVEIDIENINDLTRRLGEDNQQTFQEKLKSILPSIF